MPIRELCWKLGDAVIRRRSVLRVGDLDAVAECDALNDFGQLVAMSTNFRFSRGVVAWIICKWLLWGSGVVAGVSRDQARDKGAEQGFAAMARVVHDLEEAKVERQLLLRKAPMWAAPGAQQRAEPVVDGGLNPRKSGAGPKTGTELAVEPLVARSLAGRSLSMPKPPLGGGRRPAFTGAYQPATIDPEVGGWMHFWQLSSSVIAVYARIYAAANTRPRPCRGHTRCGRGRPSYAGSPAKRINGPQQPPVVVRQRLANPVVSDQRTIL